MFDETYVIVDAGDVVVDANGKLEQYDVDAAREKVNELNKSLSYFRFEIVKVTRVDYCGECQRDFNADSIVHYAAIENNCFCWSCKEKLNIKDWELRYFMGKE